MEGNGVDGPRVKWKEYGVINSCNLLIQFIAVKAPVLWQLIDTIYYVYA